MCGISGVITKNKITEQEKEIVTKMNDRLIHRGPNSEGSYSDAQIEIKMRRLAIIDLGGGDQPLYNEDRSIVLIANGEIYNFIELREELIKKGHEFKTGSDCETIIHLYEEYGEELMKHLRGMFSFCLYDKKNAKVLLVRDQLGEKPMYLYRSASNIYFSSEMKSILEAVPKNSRILDKRSVLEYFYYQYVPEPNTLIKGIEKLPGGHLVSISLQTFNVTIKKYWDMENSPLNTAIPHESIRSKLDEIEKIITRSDVPVGISLSGGIDSSVIATLAARYSKNPLHAFSVGYPGYPENDERKSAKKLAETLGLTFHPIEIKKEEFVQDFRQVVHDMDDPVADIAAYGYYRIAKEARDKKVPVLLAGFGGDELFWGYTWVVKAAQLNHLKQHVVGKIIVFFKLLNERRSTFFKRPISILIGTAGEAFSNKPLLYEFTSSWRKTDRDRKKIFTPEFLLEADHRLLKTQAQNPTVVTAALITKIWLMSNCVALGDRLSMAHGVELRLPLLDSVLYETVFGLIKNNPDVYKNGYKRWLIDAVKDILPSEIIERKKQGFNPPVSDWLKSLIESNKKNLKEGVLVREKILSPAFLRKAYENPSQSEFLHRAIVLEVWLQHFYE